MSKKVETSIHIANGGNHSQPRHREHRNMLLAHPYTNGRLYHIVLTGSEDRKVYRKALETLCKHLRAKGMPCRYKACYERDKWKRFHMHVFLLIEAKEVHPDSVIHYSENGWMTKMLHKLGLGFKIAEPNDRMHYVAGKQVNYAHVPKKASPKLDDCLLWISYLTKVRSKQGVEGQIYTGSTNREPMKTQPERNYEAITEKAANSSIESVPANQELGQPGHCMEASPQHSVEATSASSETKAGNASSECSRSPGRADTHYQPIEAVSRESSFPLDRPIGEGSIRQMIRKGSILVENEPPLKLMSRLAQNIVDNGYGLAHN